MNILMTNKNKLITNIKNIYWSQVEYIELIDKNTLIPIDIDKYTDYKKKNRLNANKNILIANKNILITNNNCK